MAFSEYITFTKGKNLMTILPTKEQFSNLNLLIKDITKAELLQQDIFFTHPFICQRRFINEKVGN